MNKLNRDDVVVDAIDQVKKGTFKVTGIKVELEANLGRGNDRNRNCSECTDGSMECQECIGWDSDDVDVCEECDGSRVVSCGWCPVSDGTSNIWGNNLHCQDFILERLVPLGLAEADENGGRTGAFKPKGALVFAKFYFDGSVDSELTFTLNLKKSKTILLLPKIIKVWNEFCKAVTSDSGQSIQTIGAGLHMAWMNDPKCHYSPGAAANAQRIAQFTNFKRSMQLLLPALFFLASADDTSRALRFRMPRIECDQLNGDAKYSAVTYRSQTLEFRAFNTCYDNPEQILDNVVVMKNCLRYWRNKYKPSGLESIVGSVHFGNDDNDELSRFYSTIDHIDLLNAGLKKLKPSYLSVTEAKKQRKFTINKKILSRVVKEQAANAATEYREYEERFTWQLNVRRLRTQADKLENEMYTNRGKLTTVNLLEKTFETSKEVDDMIQVELKRKKPLNLYVDEKMKEFNKKRQGQYRLGGI